MNDRRGTTLGKYRLIERLGEGGMGAVYRARDEMLDRDVAIKVLRPALVQETALVERFRTEAIALARLAHPRIALLYGLEREGEEFYMVMEYLKGETLEALVAREGRLPWRRAAEICIQVAEALDHAHDHGVVHRDIKPANIMVGPGDVTKVMDFGIARMAGSSRQTRHGHSVGTPAYMAPEQLRGEECDGRTDLYALGAVFYELVTGKLAFDADSDYKLMMQQLHEPPPPPSASNPSLPTIVDRTVLRAMSKSPTDRFATAAAMRNALMEAAASVVLETAAHRSPPPMTRVASSTPLPFPQTVVPPRGMEESVTSDSSDPAIDATPTSRPLWLDWRTWSTVAMLAVAVGVAVQGGDSSGEAASPPNGPPPVETSPDQTTPSPDPVGANLSPVPPSAPFIRGGGGGNGATPPPVSAPAPIPVAPPPPPRATSPTPKAPRERRPPPESPAAPPPGAAPVATPGEGAPSRDDRPAIAAAVQRWFGENRLTNLSGTVDGESVSKLIAEGRLTVSAEGQPAISIQGEDATADVRGAVHLRSTFGASKKRAVRFTLSLTRSSEGSWRVTRGSVQG